MSARSVPHVVFGALLSVTLALYIGRLDPTRADAWPVLVVVILLTTMSLALYCAAAEGDRVGRATGYVLVVVLSILLPLWVVQYVLPIMREEARPSGAELALLPMLVIAWVSAIGGMDLIERLRASGGTKGPPRTGGGSAVA